MGLLFLWAAIYALQPHLRLRPFPLYILVGALVESADRILLLAAFIIFLKDTILID